MNDSTLVNVNPPEAYTGYASSRPNYALPNTPGDLLRMEPAFRRRYLPLLPSNRQARILDIGCGCGEFLYFLQRQGFENTRGVDLDPQQIVQGQRLGVKNIEAGPAESFLSSYVDAMDSIVAIDVLEHIPKTQVLEFLERVRRSLKPGGRFICQVPNLAAFFLPYFFMDFTHETPFTAASLKQALQMAGFSAVQVRPAGPLTHGLKSGLRSALWRGLSLAFRLVAAVEAGPRSQVNSIFTAAIIAVAERR